MLIELVRSAKPSARFHQLSCALRFVVPGDVRYTHCDCAEAPPCAHVPLAVWAFRRLAADLASGVVSTQTQDLPIPADLLDAGESLLGELLESGLAGLAPNWADRVRRLLDACGQADLIWPAAILGDLIQQQERYASHDARFLPRRVAELLGEWLIRADAIRSGTRAVPQLLIRGSRADRAAEIGSARYIGVGCGVEQDRVGATVTAYLQDIDSGGIVAVSRDFPDPTRDSGGVAKDYHQLAATSAVRGVSLAALGAGQMLLQSGKRAADHRLSIGRAKASVNPQQYRWDALRAPLLAEDFAEVRARLAALPPASLRPRYVAENLFVIPIAAVSAVRFDEATQSAEALVFDCREEPAALHHPYHHRGREGCDALLAALRSAAAGSHAPKFIAARVHPAPGRLVLHPITLVFENGDGRSAVQPWADRYKSPPPAGGKASTQDAKPPPPTGFGQPATAGAGDSFAGPAPRQSIDAIADYPAQLLNHLGELALLGLSRVDARLARAWKELARSGEALGYDRLVRPVADLARLMEAKLSTPDWNPDDARRQSLQLALLARLAADIKEQVQ